MTYQELKSEEQQYVMQTYGRFPIALDHGQGAQLWDVEGKRYIDLASGIGVNCLGYNHPVLTHAIEEQIHKLMHVSNLFTTAPMIQTAKTLVQATGMGKVFFANSGAEANEGAIKLARKYSYDKYGAGRSKIITLWNSFHGRTVTTLKAPPARTSSTTTSSPSPRALTTPPPAIWTISSPRSTTRPAPS